MTEYESAQNRIVNDAQTTKHPTTILIHGNTLVLISGYT